MLYYTVKDAAPKSKKEGDNQSDSTNGSAAYSLEKPVAKDSNVELRLLMDKSSTNPHPPHISIIAIPHPLGDLLLPSLPSKNIHRAISSISLKANSPQIHLLHIPQHPLLKPAQPSLH